MLVISAAQACQSDASKTPGEIVQRMESKDNGFVRNITAGQMQYSIQLAPPEYMASKDVDASSENNTELLSRTKELEGYLFFIVKIQRKQSTQSDNEREAMYFTSQAQQDIQLQYGGSSLLPTVYNYENNYGLTPYNTLVIGFETGTEPLGDVKLVFNDQFNRNPRIQASFSASQLNEVSSL